MEDTNHQDNEDIADESSETVAEDNDDEYEDHFYPNYKYLDKDTLQKLKKNDLTLLYLTVSLNCDYQDGECFFNSIDWKKDGDCISNNTQLKKIKLSYSGSCLGRPPEQPYILGEQGHNLPTKEKLQDFFSCIYQSRSIKDIEISSMDVSDEFGGGLIEGLQGHPSLTKLQIGISRLGSVGCTAIGNVLKHPKSKLKELRIPACYLDGNGLGILCEGLLGNSTLQKLYLGNNEHITSVGWRALSTVLQHPNCKLIYLDLPHTGINNASLSLLGSALRDSSIKALNLYNNLCINRGGWQTLFKQLSRTTIEHLDLFRNNIDIGDLSLLGSIKSLKSVNLASNRSTTSTPSRWQSFFNSLQRSNTKLKKLDISYNHIGNEGAIGLGSLLSTMSSLKTLQMNGLSLTGDGNNNVTSQGWVSLFTTLQDSNLDLVKLQLIGNNIDDEGVQLLISLVSRMSTLKVLSLAENVLITPTGLEALSGYLRNPNLALEDLNVDENNHSDDTMIAFTSVLAQNKTLTSISLGGTWDDETDEQTGLITDRGWEAVSSLLCNKSSILDTYNSNHTLQHVGDYYSDEVGEKLCPYLDMNENKDKAEVARQKILQTHFSSSDDDMQEVLDMELEIIPTAVAWIGRPIHIGWIGKNVSGLSTMFNLLRRLPDLFDSNAQKKKPSEVKE